MGEQHLDQNFQIQNADRVASYEEWKSQQPTMGKVDLDRGVIQTFDSSGWLISMYVDEPGTYRDAQGRIVSEEVAERAGFDIQHFARERRAQERKAQLQKLIAEETARIEAEWPKAPPMQQEPVQQEDIDRHKKEMWAKADAKYRGEFLNEEENADRREPAPKPRRTIEVPNLDKVLK